MDSKLRTKTKRAAAARADISISSAYRIDKGKITGDYKRRNWRTRKDPFDAAWTSIIVPHIEAHPNLLAITILEKLQEDFPGEYPDKLLRTLQRKIKKWKVLHGPKKPVIFRQEHVPGRMGISDFTELKGVVITIRGEVFTHILYHFRLSYCGWSFVSVICGGESCDALLEGLQEALWRLGGAPKEHRTDSLSAAFKNLSKEALKDTTIRYAEFCAHYKMLPTRNNKGIGHENGSIESPHGHVKKRIKQALILRGSNDFDSIECYQKWLDDVVSNHNRRNLKELEFERQFLQKLPMYKTTDFSTLMVRVHSSSTVEIKRITYSVPSRLCSLMLRAHIYQDRIELYHGSDKVFAFKRVYALRGRRAKVIDYKHIIHALYKKPQAFRYSQIRNNILPSDKFRFIWDHLNNTMNPKDACQLIVKMLYCAEKYDCEKDIERYVLRCIRQNKALSIISLESRYRKCEPDIPSIEVIQHSLSDYNKILEN